MFNGRPVSHTNTKDVDLVFSLLMSLRERVSLALAMTVRNLSLEECVSLLNLPLVPAQKCRGQVEYG